MAHAKMKIKLKQEYLKRFRKICRSELNSNYKFQAINTFAVPVLRYSFGIINWRKDELKQIDRKSRKTLTINSLHHPKSDVNRIYLPRNEGGRGLLGVETTWMAEVIGLNVYLNEKTDKINKFILKHDQGKKLYSISKYSNIIKKEFKIDCEINKTLPTVMAKKEKEIFKNKLIQHNIESWKQKPMHGQILRLINKPNIDKNFSFQWLKSAKLKGPTEGFVLAAQDQSLNTRYHQNKILKLPVSPNCRMCKQRLETVEHIVSGCPLLALTEYTHRHDRVCKIIHFKLCKIWNINTESEYWYNHEPKDVVESREITSHYIGTCPYKQTKKLKQTDQISLLRTRTQENVNS